MRNKWHDTDKKRPPRDEVVAGLWFYLTETYLELCYYDPDTKKWFSAQPGSVDNAIESPDYWIELPD